jgi:hypothetical protein
MCKDEMNHAQNHSMQIRRERNNERTAHLYSVMAGDREYKRFFKTGKLLQSTQDMKG